MSWIKKYARCYQKNTVVMQNYTIYITGILDQTVTISYDYLGVPRTITGITNGETIEIPVVGVSNLIINAPDVQGYIKTITNESNIYNISYTVDIYNGHDYVEIDGLKWATMNVGANSITDIGFYFQWADTQGYTAAQVGTDKNFSWTDYKYTNDDGSTMSKYNSTDGKTTLEASDDALAANWGGSWRIPTVDEFIALGNATNTQWTSNYQNSNVSGLILTDKTDNSKELFFPAAGIGSNNSIGNTQNMGFYWTSSLKYTSDIKKAYFLIFGSSMQLGQQDTTRSSGLSIRGVIG